MMMEKWMPNVLTWINGKESEIIDAPLNNFFNENGFESILFIKNIGSTIIYFLIYILMWISLGFISLISNCS